MSIVEKYKEHVKSPLVQHVGAAAIGTLGAALLYGPATDTLDALVRPLAAASNGGSVPRSYERRMDRIKESSGLKWGLAAAAGLLGAGASVALTYRGNERHGGVLRWNAPVDTKRYDGTVSDSGAFFDHGISGALSRPLSKGASVLSGTGTIDYSQPVNRNVMCDLVINDPFLHNYPYSRNMAVASLTAARPLPGPGHMTTLGAVKDAAMQKLEKKLTFGGVANVAARTMLANAGANLFANTVGTLAGLSQNARRNLVSAGTVAGAISSIF